MQQFKPTQAIGYSKLNSLLEVGVICKCKEAEVTVMEVEVTCRHMGEEVMVMEGEGICRHMEEVVIYRCK